MPQLFILCAILLVLVNHGVETMKYSATNAQVCAQYSTEKHSFPKRFVTVLRICCLQHDLCLYLSVIYLSLGRSQILSINTHIILFIELGNPLARMCLILNNLAQNLSKSPGNQYFTFFLLINSILISHVIHSHSHYNNVLLIIS